MSWVDHLIAGVVLAGALWLLYRSLWKKQGACHGCASGGCCGSRPREPGELVRLGRAGRPGGGGPAPRSEGQPVPPTPGRG